MRKNRVRFHSSSQSRLPDLPNLFTAACPPLWPDTTSGTGNNMSVHQNNPRIHFAIAVEHIRSEIHRLRSRLMTKINVHPTASDSPVSICPLIPMARQYSPIFLFALAAFPIAAGNLPSPTQATELEHDLYICASMTKDFTIGKRTTRLSGLFYMEDRTTPHHLGFNHPRQDSVAIDPRDSNAIFTVGLNGVLRSLDGGENWRIMTSWDMTEPKDIAIDPNSPDHIYIALPDGIGVSRDRGATWQRMDTGIRRKYTQSILVDRTQAGRLVAGTEKGIYLSEDGARNWTLVQSADATVTDVEQSPHDPLVFLATTQENGALMSRDGGRTWKQLDGLTTAHTLHNGDFDATNPDRLAVSAWSIGVQVSEDGGKTWTARNDGLPSTNVWKVGIDPDIPDRLYCSPHQEAVYISDDFGQTWQRSFFEGAVVWDFAFITRS